MSKHAAIWIDHKEAHILLLRPDRVDEATVLAPRHNIHHKHPRGAGEPTSHPDDEKRFFHEVARSLDGSDAVLVVGPSKAKLDFIRYLRKHERAIESAVVGMETVDHPTDAQLMAFVRQYFSGHPDSAIRRQPSAAKKVTRSVQAIEERHVERERR